MIHLRKAALSDRRPLARFLQPFKADGQKSISLFDVANLLSKERQFLLTLAENDEGQIVGLQALLPTRELGTREIVTLIVSSQSIHTGSKLFTETQNLARNKGLNCLEALVPQENTPALIYYKSHGFEHISRASGQALLRYDLG